MTTGNNPAPPTMAKPPRPNLPPIFVISLARAKSRRKAITQRLNALGLHYEVVDAVDGKTANPATYQPRLRQDIARRKFGRELLPGEIGCYLSHYNLWQRIAAEQIPQAIVLEDDAAPNADFAAVVADVLSLDASWDVIHLAARRKERVDVIVRGLGGKDYVFGRYQRRLLFTCGYLISLAGAQKQLDICREISEPVDHAWGHWWRGGLLFYCVAPQLARQAEEESIIGFRHSSMGNWTDRVVGSIWRRLDRMHCGLFRLMHPPPKIKRRGE